uniref:LAGLIDADG endonuclease n=1 Tax=Pyronema omphalodes TaxID=337075 RepID=A0A140IMX6_9PEZI|nr:LAGLIDADG endonuclease [Pyronema omphalodes]AMO66534.1 LAGLIDADG endonuclease [Pyronema omphalodes]
MINLKNYSTLANTNGKISPWWITGYTDGDGSFLINTFKSKSTTNGYSVIIIFQLTAHYSEIEFLRQIQDYFGGIGAIVISPDKTAVYFRVQKLSDILQIIIPPKDFVEYPLQSTKFVYFYLFKEVAFLLDKKAHLSLGGFQHWKVLSYKAARCA